MLFALPLLLLLHFIDCADISWKHNRSADNGNQLCRHLREIYHALRTNKNVRGRSFFMFFNFTRNSQKCLWFHDFEREQERSFLVCYAFSVVLKLFR